ncbi:chromatin remodeling and histone acetyltransferase complexes subunit [Colletotrichum musicola]|uniref:Chromatin remodeling and histone acetyltransferase complexes subunit n=1 Tax=Colletotrichum musicola TaxID=2175873 RepID=A0A8H6NSQ4_9PEZI|nr:chromatin remodeling and histone acetyltransferase complexes subunit [Colletotrichum musicola]
MAQPMSSSVQPTDIYGGDEVSALVLDPGYCSTRAGFAGEDVPKAVFSSFYGRVGPTESPAYFFGDEHLIPRADLEMRNYMSRDSVVEDWDVASKLWENMLSTRLQPPRATPASKNGLNDDPKTAPEGGEANGDVDVAMEDAETQEKSLQENPLLMTEAPWNSVKSREKALEIVMENWGCPAFWLSRTPVLAAFAAGKASALVIDVGGANTSVTAIHDGMVLKRSIHKSPVGGLWLSSQVRSLWDLSEPKIEPIPTFLVEAKTPVDAGASPQFKQRQFPFPITDSFRAYENERLVTEFKESVVETWRGPGKYTVPQNEEFAKTQPGRIFEFPNGANQMWREQRYKVSEGMWDETAAFPTANEELRLSKSQTIPELIRAALNAVDVDLRPNLLGNIVVTGSTSLLNGFNDRLNNELTTMYPGLKIKIHAAGLSSERHFGAWIGGSILGSLGTFHQMWISRKEYEENGASIVEKRCK